VCFVDAWLQRPGPTLTHRRNLHAMRARRLPIGGLATLTALLAALAVVLVAGAPAARTVIDTVFASTTTSTTTSTSVVTTTTLATVASRSGHPGSPRSTTPHTTGGAPRSTSGGRSTRPTTGTTSRHPVKASAPPVTTTTRPRSVMATPVTRTGTLLAGVTSWSTRVGPVDDVSVSVQPGRRVTLTVVCGLATSSATSLATATVAHLRGEGSCRATFSIPVGGTGAVAWRMVTT
jgi:hypothetical protein